MPSANVLRVMAALVGETEREIVMLAAEVHAELVEATPVDTGWARSNWLISVGAPATDLVGSREAVQADSPARALAELVAAYRLEMGSVFIPNNVPYIQDLNDGSSTQAPSGFVEAAIERGVQAAIAKAASR